MAYNVKSWFTVTKLTWFFLAVSIICTMASLYTYQRIQQIHAFNQAVLAGKTPETDQQSFEAKFATALYLAKKERYKEATLLFTQLLPKANTTQRAAVQYNIGNMFFLRGLAINGTNMTVRNEAEYFIRQAKTAYQASLKLDNTQWDARHNMDRLLTMLPGTPTPGVGESDTPGLIMGNIPVGLP
jgi:tetratricopeptide (TPR) repeat protein